MRERNNCNKGREKCYNFVITHRVNCYIFVTNQNNVTKRDLIMAKTPKILVVDDEESICYVLKLNLELAGFIVDTAGSAEQALRMKLERYDLFLLDVMMKHVDGFELARLIRENKTLSDTPIIFCTAKDKEDDLLQGFSTGADDYIKKPFSMRELVARVRSVLHRTGRFSMDREVAFEGLQLDKVDRTCKVDGEDVPLTTKEFDLTVFFLENRDRVFSRSEILNRVWSDYAYVIDRTVDVNIGRLRKKLGIYGKNIITKQGQGYGFKTVD